MGRETAWACASTTANRASVGDLIEFLDPVFRHWAVFVGFIDEKAMICHFYQWDENEYEVQYDTLVHVADGRECRVNNKYDDLGHYDEEEILKRCYEAVKRSERGNYRSYNAAAWNCEHFASHMRNGKGCCDQNSGKMLFNPKNWLDSARSLGTKWGGSSSSSSRSSSSSSSASSFSKKQQQKFG